MPSRVALVVVLLCAAAGGRALAHHSFAAEFDATKAVRVTGTLAKVEWTNPHTYFYIDVVDEQSKAKANWMIEMGSPNVLMRSGWTRNTLKVGDVVTVEGSKAKDGSNTGNATTVKLASTGQRLFAGSSGAANSGTP